jgi:outer membrane protein assembly factor BamD (BamD/ComL family)
MFYALVFRWGTFHAPAWLMLALWMLEQFVMTLVEVSVEGSRVAYSAHAAGFFFGGSVAFLLRATGIDSQLERASERAADQSRPGWTEHPLYVKAMDLRDRGDHAGAANALTQLVLLAPSHVVGRQELLEHGLARHDTQSIDLALPYLIDFYHRTHADERLCGIYRELRRARPEYGLTDQELLRIATAAGRRQRSEIVIAAVTELLEQHPHSAAQPRALWIAAEAQARNGSTELQLDTLKRIVERFPDHACATLAREQLAREQLAREQLGRVEAVV